jgi:exosortase K
VRGWNAALLGGVLWGAYLLKRFYSVATPDELAWLLGPTAALVEQASGRRFVREEGLGYVSSELSLVIAPVCAGINYLIVAFLALTFGFLHRMRTLARKFGWLVGSALLAYAATLVVNAVRITLSVALGRWSSPELHRVEGIVVYLSSLLVLYLAVDQILGRRPGRLLGAVGLPVACYLGVTVVAPLCRGAYAHPEYWRHAGVVVVASAVLAALAATWRSATLKRISPG